MPIVAPTFELGATRMAEHDPTATNPPKKNTSGMPQNQANLPAMAPVISCATAKTNRATGRNRIQRMIFMEFSTPSTREVHSAKTCSFEHDCYQLAALASSAES